MGPAGWCSRSTTTDRVCRRSSSRGSSTGPPGQPAGTRGGDGGGAGLGLALVSQHVHAHGGTISVDKSVDDSAARVREARETLGPEVGLMVDAHGTWCVREAQRFARKVERLRPRLAGGAGLAGQPHGQAEVRAATDIPIAAGESEQTRFAFRE